MDAARRRRPDARRARESLRPPRYRLLTAAAAIPQRAPDVPRETFEAPCPACGRDVVFTQIVADTGVTYSIEEHACVDG